MGERCLSLGRNVVQPDVFSAGCARWYLEYLFNLGLDKDRFIKDCNRYRGSYALTEYLKLVAKGIYDDLGFMVNATHYVRILAVIQRYRADARKPVLV